MSGRAGRPLRVALVADWYLPRRGGIELQLRDLAARLAAGGHRADVITPHPAGPDVDDTGRVVRLDVPRLPAAGVAFTPALATALHRALRDGAYDVVHCHASVVAPATWVGAWTARRLGLPCVATFHSVLHGTRVALAAAERVVRWSRWPLVASGVSEVVAAQLRRAAPAARVIVLPNGVDVAWWRAVAAEAREPGGQVVAAMRLSRKKRPHVLVAVAERLVADAAARGARPPRVVVAGDGPARADVERLARRRGVHGAMAFLGWQPRERVRALLAGADAFVLPTVHESFGIAALEARAAGVPVVARGGTGVGDFVRDGHDGVLAGSDAALVDAVARVAGDAAYRTRLAAASHAAPPSAFDWAAVIARHEAAYRAAGA